MDRDERALSQTVRVVVVDDEPMVCDFLRVILTSSGQVTVDAVAHDGAEGLAATQQHRPDLVLMDLRMPHVDGITATARIRALPDPPVVVAMTTLDTDQHVRDALDAGASGFLLKTTPPNQLVPLVVAAATGASVLSEQALQRLRDQRPAQQEHVPDPEIQALPERERQVLALVAEGLSNADIAARLYLSEGTVKGHVSRLMTALGCENRTQLALRAVRST